MNTVTTSNKKTSFNLTTEQHRQVCLALRQRAEYLYKLVEHAPEEFKWRFNRELLAAYYALDLFEFGTQEA